MTNFEPKCDDSGRYSTMETARMLGIHRNTLNNHTNAGHIRCGRHKYNLHRFYIGKEIKRFWRAHLLS